MTKLNVLATALAVGVLWSGGVLLTGVLSLATGEAWCGEFVKVVGSVYKGYSSSVVGIILGVCWSFADGFVFGLILAFLYNLFARLLGKEESGEAESSPESS